MATTAELRQILKQDSSGKNLYDHLTETLMKILLDRPPNAFDNFELISAQVKENPLSPDRQIGREVPASLEEITTQTQWTQRCSNLLKKPDEPPEDNGVKFPDLMDEANLFEWAGISIGKAETYKLYVSIKKLAESLPSSVERLRFFGRISTRTLPYYIVEGLQVEEIEDLDEKLQEGKSGSNKYAYWVSQHYDTSDSSSWTKLPDVVMAQVVAARKFKRFFTGDLSSAVPSYPPFPGVERHFLRATIARIAGACSISPAGNFEIDEDSEVPAIKPVEAEALAEAFPKPAKELMDPEAWKHHEVDLNILGRCTAMPEAVDENGDPIEPEVEVEVVPLLSELTPENWSFRMCPGAAGSSDMSLVVVKSLVWPGAIAFASGRRYLNLYFGNGLILEKTTYTPPMPAPIQMEWNLFPSNAEANEESALDFAAMISENGGRLEEQPDVRVDPTPPVEDEEEEN